MRWAVFCGVPMSLLLEVTDGVLAQTIYKRNRVYERSNVSEQFTIPYNKCARKSQFPNISSKSALFLCLPQTSLRARGLAPMS